MTAGSLALAFAAALAGAGLYVNGVEQPARLALDDAAMLKEWGPSDRRGVALMAALALLAGDLRGCRPIIEGGDVRFAIGALIALASWPYTLYAMGAGQQPDHRARAEGPRRRARARLAMGPARIRADRDRARRGGDVPVGAVRRAAAPDRRRRREPALFHPPAARRRRPARPISARIGWAAPLAGALRRRARRGRASSRARGARPVEPAVGDARGRGRGRSPPARCTRTASPTSPTASAAGATARPSSRSCATAGIGTYGAVALGLVAAAARRGGRRDGAPLDRLRGGGADSRRRRRARRRAGAARLAAAGAQRRGGRRAPAALGARAMGPAAASCGGARRWRSGCCRWRSVRALFACALAAGGCAAVRRAGAAPDRRPDRRRLRRRGGDRGGRDAIGASHRRPGRLKGRHDVPSSPCVKICVVDPLAGLCIGCGRTVDEISLWPEMEEARAPRRDGANCPRRMAAARSRTARGGRVGRRARA